MNPKLLDDGKEGQIGHIRILGNKTVIVNHFWIGVESSGKNEQKPK